MYAVTYGRLFGFCKFPYKTEIIYFAAFTVILPFFAPLKAIKVPIAALRGLFYVIKMKNFCVFSDFFKITLDYCADIIYNEINGRRLGLTLCCIRHSGIYH